MVATNKLAAVMTEVTGGGAGAPIVTSIGNLTLSNTTPNGRIDYGDTPSSTFAAGAGCMAVSLEFTASNYFTTQAASHTAIVLRQDMALAGLQVRGQGAIFGALLSHPAAFYPESWFNGVGTGNRVFFEHGTSSAFVVEDGKRYRMWIESLVAADAQRYLRYAVWKYNTATAQWDLGLDSGHVLDTNEVFDPTKTGLIIGQVFADTGVTWSIAFEDVQVIWSAESLLGYASATGSEAVPGQIGTLSYKRVPGTPDVVATQGLKLTDGVAIAQNSAGINSGQASLVAVRDASASSQVGTTGAVNSTLAVIAHSGTVSASSEAIISALGYNNSLDASCGVAGSFTQVANTATGLSGSPGPVGGVWGHITQVFDNTFGGEIARPLCGEKIDIWVSGVQANANGALIACGDSKKNLTGTASANARAKAGLKIFGQDNVWWETGISLTAFQNEGLLISNSGTNTFSGQKAVNAVKLLGDYSGPALAVSPSSASCGIDLSSASGLTGGVAIKMSSSQKFDLGTGYSSWGTVSNTAAGGSYDASLSGWPNDNATLFGLLRTLYQAFGYLTNELKGKGIIR